MKKIKRFIDVSKRFWIDAVLITTALGLSILVFKLLLVHPQADNNSSLLTNLLTVNSVFSAILITYLFTRVTWTKERKLEYLNEGMSISQKITEYRRILSVLIRYYQLWINDRATKSLIDTGKFQHIDYYDFRLASISDYVSEDHDLIKQLRNHPDFAEGLTNVYLAISSMVKDRKRDYYWQEELYKDFEYKGIYTPETVDKWMEAEIAGSIWYWFQRDGLINFGRLGKADINYMQEAAGRINPKYLHYPVDYKLIKELSEDINGHYLPNLSLIHTQLKEGISGISTLILNLTSMSLISGVLAPFLLLLVNTGDEYFKFISTGVVSINGGLILYFILKFPFLIRSELKWDLDSRFNSY